MGFPVQYGTLLSRTLKGPELRELPKRLSPRNSEPLTRAVTIGALTIRIGFGVYSTIIIIRNPQNLILITKAGYYIIRLEPSDAHLRVLDAAMTIWGTAIRLTG